MARETFPYEGDREVIRDFLAGKARGVSDQLAINGGALTFNTSSIGNPITAAWFDTAGALVAKIPAGYDAMYVSAIVEEILRQLRMDERKLVRDVVDGPGRDPADLMIKPGTEVAVQRHFAWFFDDVRAYVDQPFVICGPLGVRAHQAEHKHGRK